MRRPRHAGKTPAENARLFASALRLIRARGEFKGRVCGARTSEITDPLMREMREMRYQDKLIDELAKGHPMEQMLRR